MVFTLTILLIFIVCPFVQGKAQFGIGLSFGREPLIVEGIKLIPERPTFYLPINLSQHFRIEPELGIYCYRLSDYETKYIYDILSYGFGVFGLDHKDQFEVSYGVRLLWLYFEQNVKYRMHRAHIANRTDFVFGPAIGGVYNFSKHFSLGGEIQFNYTKVGKWDPKGYKEYDVTLRSSLQNVSLVFIRWYF